MAENSRYSRLQPAVSDNPTLSSEARRRTIVIDPGHGAPDVSNKSMITGASTPGGVRESDLNLSFSRRLGAALEQRGYNVVYSRNGETAPPGHYDYNTSARPRSAVGWRAQVDPKADLFISIHHDDMRDGLKRLTRSAPPTLFSYDGAGNSGALAGQLAKATEGKTGANDYAVLKPWLHQPTAGRDRPAVLAEMGNMNNPSDVKRTTDPHQAEAMAARMAGAIDRFMQTPEAKAGFPLSKTESATRVAGREKDFAAGTLPGSDGKPARSLADKPLGSSGIAAATPPGKDIPISNSNGGEWPQEKRESKPKSEAKEGWFAWGARKLGISP